MKEVLFLDYSLWSDDIFGIVVPNFVFIVYFASFAFLKVYVMVVSALNLAFNCVLILKLGKA